MGRGLGASFLTVSTRRPSRHGDCSHCTSQGRLLDADAATYELAEHCAIVSCTITIATTARADVGSAAKGCSTLAQETSETSPARTAVLGAARRTTAEQHVAAALAKGQTSFLAAGAKERFPTAAWVGTPVSEQSATATNVSSWTDGLAKWELGHVQPPPAPAPAPLRTAGHLRRPERARTPSHFSSQQQQQLQQQRPESEWRNDAGDAGAKRPKSEPESEKREAQQAK
mmetsp:Transcript_49104/g.104527  ORF Transcript_49104/g.104527 Transcript_49104/m.104527 type:complete len:229 (+) Transcript_49104:1299-1985(+)